VWEKTIIPGGVTCHEICGGCTEGLGKVKHVEIRNYENVAALVRKINGVEPLDAPIERDQAYMQFMARIAASGLYDLDLEEIEKNNREMRRVICNGPISQFNNCGATSTSTARR